MTNEQKKKFVIRMTKARRAAGLAKRRNRSTDSTTERFDRVTHAAAPRKNRRPNPEEMAAAEAMYEAFHGRPANRTIDYDQHFEYRAEVAELGKLKELRFELAGEPRPVPLKDFGACQVTCTPDGKNIYFLGGDQTIDLLTLGIDSDKDFVELGPASYIMYHTKKGFHDFAPVDYFHTFGEEDNIRPLLMYDRQNSTLFLAGGNYQCRPEGIVN